MLLSFLSLTYRRLPVLLYYLALHLDRECFRYWMKKTDPRRIARTTVYRITNITTFITWAGRARSVVFFRRKTRRLTDAFQSILRECVCVSVSVRSSDWEESGMFHLPAHASTTYCRFEGRARGGAHGAGWRFSLLLVDGERESSNWKGRGEDAAGVASRAWHSRKKAKVVYKHEMCSRFRSVYSFMRFKPVSQLCCVVQRINKPLEILRLCLLLLVTLTK